MSALPMDPSSPLYRLLYPGMPQPNFRAGMGPSWLPGGQSDDPFGMGGGGVVRPPAPPQGVAQAGAQSPPPGWRGLFQDRDLALALLANSGPSGRPTSFGQILGNSFMQADAAKQGRSDDELMRRYREAQIAKLESPTGSQSQDIQEYEYAKQQGYGGSYQDWITAKGQSSRPSSVQEWEFYDKLPEAQKRAYLEMKRNPNWKVTDVNQVPTVVQGGVGGNVQTTPLSTLPQVAAAAGTVKQAESAGGALGSAQGGVQGEIQKKGSNAQTMLGMIDEADKLIDKSTGSLGGAGVDILAGAIGKSTEGAQAIARLKVIQAGMMTNMPRMEGPQSDRDVELYRQAAADIGNPTAPRETRKAALQTIRDLQMKYAERAKQPFNLFPNGSTDAEGWTTLPGGIRVREKK